MIEEESTEVFFSLVEMILLSKYKTLRVEGVVGETFYEF